MEFAALRAQAGFSFRWTANCNKDMDVSLMDGLRTALKSKCWPVQSVAFT